MTAPTVRVSTNAFAAKRAVFDWLASMAADGRRLEGRQVEYEWPGDRAQRICIYGGGVTFTQTADASDGEADELAQETAAVSVYVRVLRPGGTVRQADEEAEEIADVIADELRRNRRFAGGNSVSRISGGQADYSHPQNDAISVVALQISVITYL